MWARQKDYVWETFSLPVTCVSDTWINDPLPWTTSDQVLALNRCTQSTWTSFRIISTYNEQHDCYHSTNFLSQLKWTSSVGWLVGWCSPKSKGTKWPQQVFDWNHEDTVDKQTHLQSYRPIWFSSLHKWFLALKTFRKTRLNRCLEFLMVCKTPKPRSQPAHSEPWHSASPLQ